MTASFFTTSSAAAELGVTPCRVRAMIAAGRIRATLAGRDWLMAPAAVDAVRDRKPGRPALTRRKAGATK
jgi:excisionase family DNA binding protein